MRIDAVLADPGAVDDVDALAEASEALGARLVLRQVRAAGPTPGTTRSVSPPPSGTFSTAATVTWTETDEGSTDQERVSAGWPGVKLRGTRASARHRTVAG